MKDSKELTVDEVQLLQGYVLRSAFKSAFSGGTANVPTGKTIGEMIKDQQKFVADSKTRDDEDKRRVEAAKVEADKKRQELLAVLAVTVYDKGANKNQYIDNVSEITLSFSYQNLSAKEIRGFKGTVVFKDVFGDVIKQADIKEDQPLGPNATRRDKRSLNYNMFTDDDKKLLATKLSEMKVVWEPDTILFTDGTSLKVDDADKLNQ